MKRIASSLIALGGALAQPAFAATLTVNGVTASGYTAFVQVGTTVFNVPDANFVVFDIGGGKEAVGISNFSVGDPATGPATTDFFVELSGVLNPDPFISWSIAANNNTAGTLAFLFGFTTPLIPTVALPSVASSQISGGLTDGTGNGLALSPFGGNLLQRVSLGAGAVSAGVDSGPGATMTGSGVVQTVDYSLTPTDPFGAGPAPAPAGSWNLLSTEIGFTLTGANDKIAMTGNAVLTPVPLPAAAWLLVGGLFGLVGVARRKPPAA
jgi:hypothetical protein